MAVNDAELRAELRQMAQKDLFGLYEAWWRANAMYPEAALSERLAVAERAVASLLNAGEIRLCRGTWQEPAEVPSDETGAVLRDWKSWQVPDGDEPWIFFIAT